MFYIWGKRKPFDEIRLYFFIVVKSGYLCWFILIIKALTGGFIDCLLGIAAGHLYIVVKDVLPLQYGKDYAACPEFLKRWLSSYTGYGNAEFRPQQPGQHPPPQQGLFFGRGVRMDD
jgi:hypothetical protein